MPRRIACGSDRSKNAWSTIVFGCVGSQKTAMRFSVIPRSVSMWKNVPPRSSEYLPASSATPKVVLEAPPPRVRAAQAPARTAVIRHMPPSSADQRTSSSPLSRVVEYGIEELFGPEPDRIVRRQTGLLLCRRDRLPGLVLGDGGGVQSNRRHLRGTELERHALVQVDQLRQAQDRGLRRVAFDDGPPHLVAEHVEMRGASVHEADGHTRVDWVEDRALPFDPQQVAALAALDDQALGRARQEIRHDGVHRDSPAGDRNTCLTRGNEDGLQAAPACLEVELADRGHLSDRAVRAHRQDNRRVDLEILTGRSAQVGRRLAQVSELDAVLPRELGQPGNVPQTHVQAVLEIEAVRDAALQQLLPIARKAAPLGDDADQCRIRLEGEGLVDRADDRHAVLRLSGTLRVEHRNNVVAPVAPDAARGLRVMRIVGELFGEDQVALPT